MADDRRDPSAATPRLGVWDAASIMIGVIIGVGIFELPGNIFKNAPGPAIAIAAWVLGGALAFVGALVFAELGSTYPRSGGEYVYLSRAFGSLVGYLFAWGQLVVIRPGSIAAMAFVFAKHAHKLFGFSDDLPLSGIAVAVVVVLTLINLRDVQLGKNTQNFMTVAKLAGMAGICLAGAFARGRPATATMAADPTEPGDTELWFAGAMIAILWTYSGWNEAAYIAAEVHDPRRNLPLALIFGTLGVTAIYVAVNLAYLAGLGFEGAKTEWAASALCERVWPGYGARAIGTLILISALGAINGMIFTTARILSEFGSDHRVFRPLSLWSKSWRTPLRALLAQGVLTCGMIVSVGYLPSAARGIEGLWAIIALTSPIFWFFFLLTGIALFVLRGRDAHLPRPFRVPLYPFLPLLFCAWCGYMFVGSIIEQKLLSLIGLAITVAGLPLYFVARGKPSVIQPLEPVKTASPT
ncbi:MAG: amino acid permease [Gemmataceae bacterium]|nr:amino acid permease [Gemmataceae bacterium]